MGQLGTRWADGEALGRIGAQFFMRRHYFPAQPVLHRRIARFQHTQGITHASVHTGMASRAGQALHYAGQLGGGG